MDDPGALVRRFLAAVADHDWDTVGASVAPAVVRVGPFGDTYHGRDAYVAFLAGLMPTLSGYAMAVDRVLVTPAGGAGAATVVAELRETVQADGVAYETPEALVFDLDGDGRIARLAVYIRTQSP